MVGPGPRPQGGSCSTHRTYIHRDGGLVPRRLGFDASDSTEDCDPLSQLPIELW